MIAGVAGGVASYLAVDPVIVRLAFVALALTGVGLLLYPVLWLIMPQEGSPRATPHQTLDEMRREAARVGEEVREVFVMPGGAARKPRYDPMTGQPIEPEAEIPINNVGGESTGAAQTGRSSQLGVILIGVGSLVLLSMLLGPLFGKLLFPLLLIGAGILILRRQP